MSLFNFIKGQFIEVIEWTDSSSNTMVYRFDDGGKEINMGAQLTVRESQVAVFVNEGQIADVFKPGRYELSTQNLPVLTALKSWKYGFNSPFKSEVYFVNTKQFLDLKWGTSNPVMMRDRDFGMIRLRAFGIYSFRVADPVAFLKEVFGTSAYFTVEGVEGQVKRTIVSSLSDTIAQSGIPALDLAANYGELSRLMLEKLSSAFLNIGLKIESFVIENISLPEEVEQAMDRHTSMGVVGDLDNYTRFQTAEAIRESAGSDNSMAGVGAGMAAAMAMAGAMQGAVKPAEAEPQKVSCISCNASIPKGSNFCPVCGKPQKAASCSACGREIKGGANFCPHCGAKQG
ncbi:MAG TPA: zinc-ribbon domain-containing protein [Christensenellaceae bacterium]|jgi:membrane protease subunit (stomatin/prohibitin family)|nr:zinc-ribbon domain-containing protein [Christensenellaceae bacterium]